MFIFTAVNTDHFINNFIYHTENAILEIITLEQLFPEGINFLPLFIHNVIIFKKVFSYIKVMCLDTFLRILYRLGYDLIFYRDVFFHAESIHKTRYPV